MELLDQLEAENPEDPSLAPKVIASDPSAITTAVCDSLSQLRTRS